MTRGYHLFLRGRSCWLCPSFMVNQRGLVRRQVVRVEQVRNQAMTFTGPWTIRIVVRVLDDPHHQSPPVVAAVAGIGVDLGQIGAVAQATQRLEDRVALD